MRCGQALSSPCLACTCLRFAVYQPPGLQEVVGPRVDALVATLASAVSEAGGMGGVLPWFPLAQSSAPETRGLACLLVYCNCTLPGTLQPTTAAALPLREENHMKAYLLLPAQRRALLQQLGGQLEEAPQGSLALEPLLQVWGCLGGRSMQQLPLTSRAASAARHLCRPGFVTGCCFHVRCFNCAAGPHVCVPALPLGCMRQAAPVQPTRRRHSLQRQCWPCW